MRLNQNMTSLNIYKNYKRNLGIQSVALNRISTGSKINSSKDNPNKLAVSEGLRMQIRSLQSAERNLQDGVSMMQSVDGTLSSIGEVLIRIKELTIQGSNSTLTDKDLNSIQAEIDQLKNHIDYTAKNSSFNGVNLLNSNKVSNNDYPIHIPHVIGANVKEEIKIPVFNVTTDVLKDEKGNTLKNLDVRKKEDKDKNLLVIDEAIKSVNSIRSRYGAIQNRMETSTENLSSTSLNLEKAESKVRDADLALEMAEYSRTSILHQTSIALMSQSNGFPQDVLRILENIK
ncbi:flagellin [Clostridium carnis]